MKRGTRTGLVWFGLLAILVFAALAINLPPKTPHQFSETQTLGMIKHSEIESYRFDQQGLILKSIYGDEIAISPHRVAAMLGPLAEANIPQTYQVAASSSSSTEFWILIASIPIVLIVVIYLLKKMSGGAYNNLFELRKTKARPVQDADKAHFADIGGNQEAVELLGDIVDFLKSPERWTAAGARIPRGVLVVGPPGTGKTLLARAVAGETNSAFFYTSAAEFVEMFVGIGAARVRDMFEKAAAQQPAVLFIDELDAIGRRRGSGVGTMHEEREQTLNQLLVLMDGLEHRARLVVMAATNRPDVLDPALLRSGRFDRMLKLSPPSLEERVAILKIHTRNKSLDPDVQLDLLAAKTEDFTGADLEVLANEATLLAVRRTRNESETGDPAVMLKMADFEQALNSMTKSNRQYDRLDTVLVESVSQFAEPVGRARARINLSDGSLVEGEVLWMNATHIKLRGTDGIEVVIAKDRAVRISPLAGTELSPSGDFQPDHWSERTPEIG